MPNPYENLLGVFSQVRISDDDYAGITSYLDMLDANPANAAKDEWRRSGLFAINDATGERRFIGAEGASGYGGLLTSVYGDGTLGLLKPAKIAQPELYGMSNRDLANMTSYANGEVDFNNGIFEAAASFIANDPILRTGIGIAEHGMTAVNRTIFDVGAMAADLTGAAAGALGAEGANEWLKDRAQNLRNAHSDVDAAMAVLERPSSGGVLEDLSSDIAAGRYADIVADAGGFLVETGQSMGAAFLIGRGLGVTGTGAPATGVAGSLGKAVVANPIAAGFQLQTTADIYNGLADRDVNRLAAVTASVIGGRTVAALEQFGLDRMFGSKASSTIGSFIGRELLPNSTIRLGTAAEAAKAHLVRSVNGLVGEGFTETTQEVAQALAEESAALIGGDSTAADFRKNMLGIEALKRYAIAGAGGALFGGVFSAGSTGASAWAERADVMAANEAQPRAEAENAAADEWTSRLNDYARTVDDAREFGAAVERAARAHDLEVAQQMALIENDRRTEAEMYGMTPEEIDALRAQGRGDLPVIPVGETMTEAEIDAEVTRLSQRSPRLDFSDVPEREISYDILYRELAETFQGVPVGIADLAVVTGNAPVDVAEAVRRLEQTGAVVVGPDQTVQAMQLIDRAPLAMAARAGWDPASNNLFPGVAEAARKGTGEWTLAVEREIQRKKLGLSSQIPILDGINVAQGILAENSDMDPGIALSLAIQGAMTSGNAVAQRARRRAMMNALDATLDKMEKRQKSRKGSKSVTSAELDKVAKLAEMLAEGSSYRQERLNEIKNRILKMQGATTKVGPTLAEATRDVAAKPVTPALEKRTARDTVDAQDGVVKSPEIDTPAKEVRQNAREAAKEVAGKATRDQRKRIAARARDIVRESEVYAKISQSTGGANVDAFAQALEQKHGAFIPEGWAYRILTERAPEARAQMQQELIGKISLALSEASARVEAATEVGVSDLPGNRSRAEAISYLHSPKVQDALDSLTLEGEIEASGQSGLAHVDRMNHVIRALKDAQRDREMVAFVVDAESSSGDADFVDVSSDEAIAYDSEEKDATKVKLSAMSRVATWDNLDVVDGLLPYASGANDAIREADLAGKSSRSLKESHKKARTIARLLHKDAYRRERLRNIVDVAMAVKRAVAEMDPKVATRRIPLGQLALDFSDQGALLDLVSTAREMALILPSEADAIVRQITQKFTGGELSGDLTALNNVVRAAILISNQFTPVTVAQTIASLERNRSIGDSAAAVIDSVARVWANKTGKPAWQFWADVVQNLDAAPSGKGFGGYMLGEGAVGPDGNGAIAIVDKAALFGSRLISIAVGKRESGYAGTLIHEFAHALHYSGLARDILSADQIAAMENYTGFVATKDGQIPSGRATEKFAHGFQMFMALGVAPNKTLAQAFKQTGIAMLSYAKRALGFQSDIFRDTRGVGEAAAAPDASKLLSFADIILRPSEIEFYSALFGATDPDRASKGAQTRSQGLLEVFRDRRKERASEDLDYTATAKFIAAETARLSGTTQPAPPAAIDFAEFLRLRGFPADIESEALLAKLRDAYEMERASMERWRATEEAAWSGQWRPAEAGELSSEERARVHRAVENVDKEVAQAALDAQRQMWIGGAKTEDAKAAIQQVLQSSVDGDMAITHPLGNKPESRFWKTTEALMARLYKRQYLLQRWFEAGAAKAPEILKGELGDDLARIMRRSAAAVNNLAGVASRAVRIATEIPSVTDEKSGNRRIIGHESLEKVVRDFGGWTNETGANFDEMWGNLQLMMLAQRQLELDRQDAEEASLAIVEKRKRRPRRTKPAQTAEALKVDLLLRGRLGAEAYAEMDEFARRISQWSHDAILGKLMNAGMIGRDEYRRITARGQRYAPLLKIKELLPPDLVDVVQTDESLKKVVHALHGDLDGVTVDPISALTHRAMVVEMLVARQAVKNNLYEGFTNLYERPEDSTNDIHVLTMPVEVESEDGNKVTVNRRVEGKEAFAEWQKWFKGSRGQAKYDVVREQIYSAWQDGVPYFYVVRDPALRVGLQRMSGAGIDLALKMADALNLSETTAQRTTKVFGAMNNLTRQVLGRPLVASVPFVLNSTARDLPALFGKSRYGITPADLLWGYWQGIGAMFPNVAAMYPDVFKGAVEHLSSQAGMAGPLSMVHNPAMVDLVTAGQQTAKGRSGLAGTLWSDFLAGVRERGAVPLDQIGDEIKSGKIGKALWHSVSNVFSLVLSPLEVLASIQDVGGRLALRRSVARATKMGENLPPSARKALGMQDGDRLAFSGHMHRARFMSEGKKLVERMSKDPTFVPSKEQLRRYFPMVVSDAEIDAMQRAVTVDFNQRGTWSPLLSAWNLFIQPNFNEWGYAMEQLRKPETRLPFVLKNMMYLSLPMLANIAYWALHREDDDWWALPVQEKFSYIHLRKNPDGTFFRVPWGIGFAKAIFADPLIGLVLTAKEQAPELVTRTGPLSDWLTEVVGMDRVWANAGLEVGDRILEQSPTAFLWNPVKTAVNKDISTGLLQAALPPFLDPALESAANWSFFRQQQIERSSSFDGIEVAKNAQRYGWIQNKVAKALGIAPSHAAHLIRSYLPGLRGAVAADLPNALVGAPQDPTDYRASGGAGFTALAGIDRAGKSWDPWGPQSEHIRIFMDFRERARKLQNEYRQLEKAGASAAKLAELEGDPFLSMAREINAIYERQGDLREWRKRILDDKSMTPEEQNIVLNFGGPGDRGMGPDRAMVLEAIEANRMIVRVLTDWDRMMAEGE